MEPREAHLFKGLAERGDASMRNFLARKYLYP